MIVNRLRYAVEHMSTGLLREAFSPIIRDWYDFACTISGPPGQDYPMAVVSNSLMVFLGTMADALSNTVEEFGPQNLSPGDVLICNDPYRSGTHVNDVLFIRPVFADGRRVVREPARSPARYRRDGTGRLLRHEEKCLRERPGHPAGPAVGEGRAGRSTFSLIFDNSRFGALLLPDFKSILEQLKLGERLVQENIARYGIDAYLGTLTYACDTSAERMRDAIARIPDGDYAGTALMDADGLDDSLEYLVKVTLRKRGHDIEADLSGTSAQARTCINCGILDTKTSVGVALTMLLDPEVPFTSGTWRNIDLVAPPATLISALPPEGPTMMFWESSGAIIAAIFNALNPVLGASGVGGDYGSTNTHNAHGFTADGTPWANVAQCGGEHGPWGATKEGDGDSYTVLFNLNNLDPATETIEHDAPVVLLRKEHAIDTGGPGLHRGGAANLKDSLWLTDAEHYLSPFRTKVPSGVGERRRGRTERRHVVLPRGRRLRREHGSRRHLRGGLRGEHPDRRRPRPEDQGSRPGQRGYHYFASQPVWRTTAGSVLRVSPTAAGDGARRSSATLSASWPTCATSTSASRAQPGTTGSR